MPANSGRDFLILKNSVALAGLRETTAAWADSGVEITSKDDDGYQTFADFSGTEAITLSGNGVVKDDTIRNIAFGGTGVSKLLTDVTLAFGDGATMSGNFKITAYDHAGNHDGEETYEISLNTSGAWVYTAAI